MVLQNRASRYRQPAYQNYDEQGAEQHPDNARIQQEIARGDRKAVAKLLCNVLESVTIKRYDVISRYKTMMLEQGAMASMMSGSAPYGFWSGRQPGAG